MSHHEAKAMQNLERNHICRVAHAPDSLDLRPRVLWLFGTMKYGAKDRQIQSPETIRLRFEQPQNDLSFKDMQEVLRDWVTRLTGLFDHGSDQILHALEISPFASVRQIARMTLLQKTTVYRNVTESLNFANKKLCWIACSISDEQK
jgi:hypothetical protein